MPKVSVVVTTYNREGFLKETILGILNQTFQDFELIVVDNFSNFDFFDFIKNLNSDKIRAYQNQNNGVIAVNRNVGIEKATGDYIAFCDDDDIWMPTKLEKQINYVNNNNLHNKQVVLYTNSIEFFETKEQVTNKRKINGLNDFLKSNQVSLSTSFVSNNFGKQRFNETPEYFAVEDYIFWMELYVSGFSFHLNKEKLIRYRVLKSSSSAIQYSISHLRKIFALIHIRVKHKDLKINNVKFCYTIVLNIVKFGVKAFLQKFKHKF